MYFFLNILKRTIYIFILLVIFTIWQTNTINAQEHVHLTLFYSKTCPHCAKEKIFLKNLVQKYQFIDYREYEVSEESDLFAQVSKKLSASTAYIPFTVIGDESIIGYQDDSTTGKVIEEKVLEHSRVGCNDVVGGVLRELRQEKPVLIDSESCADEQEKGGTQIKIPLIGTVNSASFTLPTLTILIAFLDGFNPCAMWILLFLISMLISLKNKKKLIILGSLFIFISSLVYFVFLAAWLNVFFFLRFVSHLRFIIGIVAIISGVIHLRDYYLKRTGCKATDQPKRQAIFQRIKKIINEKSFWLALLGISALAISVNMLELVCSAGLPAIYTNVLSLSDLPSWKYYLYLILYIFVFMLDDLLVFLLAIKTFHTTGVSSKFNRFTNLVGGIIILMLGVLLIFKPEWVMFA